MHIKRSGGVGYTIKLTIVLISPLQYLISAVSGWPDDARRRETPRIQTTRSPPWPSRARGRHGCSSYAITFSSARARRTHPSHHGGEEAVLENAPGSAAARRSMRPSDELQAPQQQGRPREEHHGRRRGSAKEKSSFDVDEQLCNKLGHTFSTPIQTFLWKEFF